MDKKQLKQAFFAGALHEQMFVMDKHCESRTEGFERWFQKKKTRKVKKKKA